jgi:hypothetical protein
MTAAQATPIPPHLSSEFYLWLWWRSERDEAAFELPHPVGSVLAWVEDRLAFRRPADPRPTSVMTGENPAASLESRAALAGGKVLHELRVALKRDDREFHLTLRGPSLDVGQLKLPQVLGDNPDEAAVDRMFLVEECFLILDGLLRAFYADRAEDGWRRHTLPAMREWLLGPSAGQELP